MGSHVHGDCEFESQKHPSTDLERSTTLSNGEYASVYGYRHALAFGRGPRMVESGQQAYELRHCGEEYEDMEDLMGAPPNIISSRLKPLRHTCLICWISFAARTLRFEG